MIKDKNTPPAYIATSHKWTAAEKQINCKICLLADNMRDCKSCPFYTPKVNAVSSTPVLNYHYVKGIGHYKNCCVCVGECVCP